jgi:integrase/recombinase XerD
MRVGEIAALRVKDVLNSDLLAKDTINLAAGQTKGNSARTVHLPKKLQDEIDVYMRKMPFTPSMDAPLIYSQKSRNGFTANTLCTSVKHSSNLAAMQTPFLMRV